MCQALCSIEKTRAKKTIRFLTSNEETSLKKINISMTGI